MTKQTQLSPTRSAYPPGMLVAGAFCLFVVLTLIAQRGGIRLSFDSYYYVEYAKEFRHRLPDRFGQSWPYGWPLVGASGGLLGLGAYPTLVAAGGASVLVLLLLSARLLMQLGAGALDVGLTLAAGAGSFLLTVLVCGVFSEVPFAAVLLALAYTLTRWPNPGAIVMSGGLALAALSLRYAGGLALLLPALWLWTERASLRSVHRLPLALGTLVATFGLAGLLLLWNRAVTGHFYGGGLLPKVPPAEWIGVAADLGWALPTAIGGFFLRDLLGFDTILRVPFGLLLLSAAGLGGGLAARPGRSRIDRALGCLILVYLVGLVTLRCRGQFDALHNGRMIFPVLFPLLLVGGRLLRPRWIFQTACVLAVALNAVLCFRGASLALNADVRAAVPLLAGVTRPDRILVNEHARSLSAHVEAPVRLLGDPFLFASEAKPDATAAAYVVIASRPEGRTGLPAPLSAADRIEINRRLDAGYEAVLSTSSLVVLRPLARPAHQP